MKRALLAVLITLSACSGGGGGAGPSLPATPGPVPTFAPPSLANVQRIGSDTFSNSSSQHATQVEPSAASQGATIVAAFQSGRFTGFGSSDISFATSFDAGSTWQTGALPGTTHYTFPAGPYDSVSDPVVAYDAAHATWLIAALPVVFSNSGAPGVIVSRSQDGVTWSDPVSVTAPNETSNDKNWIACDNHPASPFYGHCYVEWDTYSGNGAILMSVSADGGNTWSLPAQPASASGGIGGQPVVQPSGAVIVPIDDLSAQHVLAFSSRDGGATWSQAIAVASIADHLDAGNIRSLPLVSAAVDAAGKVYVVWQDCRYRSNCVSNDLVMSTSADGVSWTSAARIPIDAVTSSVDHFLPGIAIEIGTAGASAHIGVTYYSYAQTQCSVATCALYANYISSQDGGAAWGAPQQLAGPMNVDWLADTIDGFMVGDYTASTFASGRALAFVALADPSMSGVFDEAMYVPKNGVIAAQAAVLRSSAGERPVPGFHSDHAPRRIHP